MIQRISAFLFSYNSLLPSSARERVTSSTYSKSPPTGTPLAIRVTLTPMGFSRRLIYMAVASPSTLARNFPQSVAELRKRLKLTDGGDIYLFATTLNDERKIIIRCEKA